MLLSEALPDCRCLPCGTRFTTMTYPKRLIEVDLPIARISAHARREKSIRHGHISTLHIWWARRPLAACRAVICAALWPDPVDVGPEDVERAAKDGRQLQLNTCPAAFREAAVRLLVAFAQRVFPERINAEGKVLQESASPESRARWEALARGTMTLDPVDPAEGPMVRLCLLDFIADFANWDNSTVPAYLETARRLTGVAHASLSDPGYQLPVGWAPSPSGSSSKAKSKTDGQGAHPTADGDRLAAWLSSLDSQLASLPRPLVVDPFCGGGSIPLEALRVGADAFASDLNPVPVLLNKVVLEYIPKYGKRLAEEVRKWGEWIKREAEQELAEFYPKDPDGATPIAYLWARTIRCEGPACGAEVPLMRSLWLAKKANRSVALQLVPNQQAKRVDFQIIVKDRGGWVDQANPQSEIPNPQFDGTVKRGSATCLCCGYTTPVARVREQLKSQNGGANSATLTAIATTQSGQSGRSYRLANARDRHAIKRATDTLAQREQLHRGPLSLVPDERFSGVEPRRIPVPQYGIDGFRNLFSNRQLLAMTTLCRLTTEINADEFPERELATAVRCLLALAVDKQADLANSLCAWEPIAECPRHLFGKQAINMVWDFSEGVPTGESSGSWSIQIDRMVHILNSIGNDWAIGHVENASATSHPLPDDVADAVITDPPYYYSVPYADLADFFYVWLRRQLAGELPDLFRSEVTPKDDECVQNLPHSEVAARQKSREFYQDAMARALGESRRITKPLGIGVVVFAHSETDAWESLLNALISAGWVVTGSWPLDTEMASRIVAQRQVTLASSVHLVCRPREDASGAVTESVGEWRDVLGELPRRIHEWMPRLASEGVVGADAIFACLGPALEIFSRYRRVEKANGDPATLREYLEFVWAAVATEALSLIFKDADAAGLEPDARLTAMWLWTLGGGKAEGAKGKAGETEDEESSDDDDEASGSKGKTLSGFTLEYDAARKIAQVLGVNLEQCQSLVEVKGDKARLLPVSERTQALFGKASEVGSSTKARKKKVVQKNLFEELGEAEAAESGWGELKGPTAGKTVLDQVHQSMILFAAGRGELMKRFLIDDGIGKDPRFWKLAQSLSALYPKECEEKRWVDGVLARKKGLGL